MLLHTLFVLLVGQIVSFTVALMSFAASYSANLGVRLPLSLSFFTYLSVTVVYGGIFLYRRQTPTVSWYWYLLLGLIDVQGNYLINKAYEYSPITSVTILSCCAIAWAIILTWIFLGTRYSFWQLLGAVLCVFALGLILFSDAASALRDNAGGGLISFLGDAMVIGGTLFFAMSNVGEEFCVKNRDRVEVVAMVGLYGLIVTIVQIFFLERQSLESLKWSPEIVLCFAGYAISSFTLYSLIPYILKMGGSTMYSLSLLTSNMWAVVIRIFVYDQKVGFMYYISFAIVVLGLTLYSINNSENEDLSNPEEIEKTDATSPLLGEQEGKTEVLPFLTP